MRADDGFTLLEMLVATAIMALMAVPIASGLNLGLTQWQAAHLQVSEHERTMLVRARLADWIEGAYPLDPIRTPDVTTDAMTGDSETVTFVSAIHPDPTRDALYRVTLRLNEDGVLQAGVLRDFEQHQPLAADTWFDLVEEVDAVDFGYVDGVDAGGDLILLDEWTGDDRPLPDAVRMEVTFKDGAPRWQTLFAVPAISERAYCTPFGDPIECLNGVGIE